MSTFVLQVGKTQLGIQLAINVQIPELFNGIGGEAIYIDTEGSFMVERVAEMAGEVSSHLLKLAKSSNARKNDNYLTHLSAAENMTMERFLEGIHVFRAHDQSELIATINHLPAFLRSKTKIKVLIVDSIAFHFRQDLNDTAQRSRVLSALAQTLNQVAFDHNLAVVLVNHVTTRFERGADNAAAANSNTSFAVSKSEFNTSPICLSFIYFERTTALSASNSGANRLVPALGEQWSHCVTNRVLLYWEEGFQRQAALVKSPTMPLSTANYCVCQKGIRDVTAAVQAVSQSVGLIIG
jgi:RAD51-like protein 2